MSNSSTAVAIRPGEHACCRFARATDRERLDDVMHDGTLVILCQYDHRGFAPGTLLEVAAAHTVDISPELGRDGDLAGARVQGEETLRFSGALDYVCADAVAGALDAHYHGDLRLDLADVGFADVSGMRALPGRKGQALTINGASESVRRLLGLLAWDTDPGVEVDA
jgi:hypothetical protein